MAEGSGDTTGVASTTRGSVGRETAEGAARSALFMAVFGVVWAAAGVVLLVVAFALASALCLGSVRLWRAARGLPSDDSPRAEARRRHSSRRFSLVFGLQGAAIALVIVLLGRYALATFIPAVVALIVGLHFFPLAKLFGARAYHVTGAALCALALVAFLLAPAWRLPFVGLGCASALFATTAYVLALVGEATSSGGTAV